jgi:hypothetical protein
VRRRVPWRDAGVWCVGPRHGVSGRAISRVFAASGTLVAKHLTFTVPKNGELELQLQGHDPEGRKVSCTMSGRGGTSAVSWGAQLFARLTSLPDRGTLFQLASVYNDHGYLPKAGDAISGSTPVLLTGSRSRVIYRPPANENEPDGQWTRFTYVVTDGSEVSENGIVWITPPHSRMVASLFRFDADGWSIVRNGAAAASLALGGIRWEGYSRGILGHFVTGTDSQVLLGQDGQDKTRWSFTAPSKFLGNQAGSYGGQLVLSMGSAGGDFSTGNRATTDARLVTLSCSSCNVGRGIRLAYFAPEVLDGRDRILSIPLLPGSWRKDPKNVIMPWGSTSSCDLVEVLSGLTAIEVLGDHTVGYETVAIDDVSLVRGSSVPVECAGVYY